MSTSSTATEPFVPIRYENFIERAGDTNAGFQKIIIDGMQRGIFKDPKKQDAVRLRLDIDRKLTVYPLGDGRRQTIVHVAAQILDKIALKIFIEMGHICDIPDFEGNTPLFILIDKYLPAADDAELRTLIMMLIKQGVRVDYLNQASMTALMRTLASSDDQLLNECLVLDLPWVETCIAVCKSAEPDEHLLERIRKVLVKNIVRTQLIERLLKYDFTGKPKGLCILLNEALSGCPFKPSWFDLIKSDASRPSRLCKLEILKNKGCLEPLIGRIKAQGVQEKYPDLVQWFEQTTSAAPALPPSPSVPPRAPVLPHAASTPNAGRNSGHRPLPAPFVKSASSSANSSSDSSPRSSLSLTSSGRRVMHVAETVPSSPVVSSPIAIPTHRRKPSGTGETGDLPERSNSWSHTPSERHPLRQRGATDLKATFNFTTIKQQLERNDEIGRRLAHNRIKDNIKALVTSEDSEFQDFLKSFLEKNPKWINQTYEGTTLLNMAVTAGRFRMSRFLLDHNAAPNGWDDDMNTPLHHLLMVDNKHDDKLPFFLKLLMRSHASVTQVNKMMQSPLDLLFIRGNQEAFEPFLNEDIDWTYEVEQRIATCYPQNDQERKCVILLLSKEKVSPKVVVVALLKRPFEERDVQVQFLLAEALTRCEMMDSAEMEGLAADTREDSLDRKVALFKNVPLFYRQLLELLLAAPNSSIKLLQMMLGRKDPAVVPDYNRLYQDTDKASRKAKLQLMMDLSIIPDTRKAEQLALGKPLPAAEALVFGLTALSPDLSKEDWPDLLKGLAAERSTLSELQVVFLRAKMPVETQQVRAIMGMLFQQNFCRSDPLMKGPFESMLEICVEHCTQVGDELLEYLHGDENSVSVNRKLKICEANKHLKVWIDHQMKISRSSSLNGALAVSSRESGKSMKSKSHPGSGSSSPR